MASQRTYLCSLGLRIHQNLTYEYEPQAEQDTPLSPGITFTITSCSYNHPYARVLTSLYSTFSHICAYSYILSRSIIIQSCNKTT